MSNYFNHLNNRELGLSGLAYSASFSSSLTGNQTVYLQIKTGAKTCFIIGYSFSSSAEPLKLTAIESPTLTNGTSAVTARNLNRQSANTATTLFYTDPTGISGGTTIHVEVCTAGKGAGAAVGDDHGWLLKKNTSYLWKIEQLTNQATVVAGELTFAEDFRSAP